VEPLSVVDDRVEPLLVVDAELNDEPSLLPTFDSSMV
jgi:hypothetical protein